MEGYVRDLIVEMPLEWMKVYLPSYSIFRPSQGMVSYLKCFSGKHIIIEENLLEFCNPPLLKFTLHFANSPQLQTDFQFIWKVLSFSVVREFNL